MKKFILVVFVVAACGSAYVVSYNETPEVSENEIALGYEQPCRISDDYRVCDLNQSGAMCYCELDYSR